MKRPTWIYLLPAVFLLAVSLPHLDQGDFRTDTGRYAAVGLQAWRDPSLFWTPHLHPAVPYFNKPPLVFWIHGLVLHVCGVSLVAARLPSIAAALGCLLLTVGLAHRLLGRTTALSSGIALALTYEFFRRTREISLDLWQLFFMLTALWFVVRAVQRRAGAGFALAGLAIGLALLCKPLTALIVIPILMVCVRGSDRLRLLSQTLPVALAVAAPWHLSMWHMHGREFIDQYFGHEVLERAFGHIHRQPAGYYLAQIGSTYWPWLAPAAVGVWHVLRRRTAPKRHRGLVLAAVWLVVWGVVLSAFPDKRPRYGLPLYPALALLAGYGLVRCPLKRLRLMARVRIARRTGAVTVCVAVAAACLPLRIQAPPDPDRAALIEWVRKAGPDPIYAAALSSNDEGLLYLRTGRWPEPVWLRPGTLCRPPPAGAKVVYTDGLDPLPGTNECVVFRSGPITVTELGAGGWHPASRPAR